MRTFILFAAISVSLLLAGYGQVKLEYYGVDDITVGEFPFLRDSLGGNFAMVELYPDSGIWKSTLEAAENHGLKLVIWPAGSGHQWTPWKWDGSSWDISDGTEALVFAENYVASGGESLVAVVMSHEPFYNHGDPFTTAEMKMLYSELKSVAPNVQLFVYMNDMAYYDKRPSTPIEDGIMDIAGIWLHCFGEAEGTVEQSLEEIDKDYQLIQDKGLNLQLFFAIQTFAIEGTDYKMPSAAEMLDFGTKVIEKDKLNGVFWYPWDQVASSYTSYLSKDRYDSTNADRWSVVKQLSGYLPETGVKEGAPVSDISSLSQNYPNPFNRITTIPYTVSMPGSYTMTVYNLYGQEVAVLFDTEIPPGSHSVEFDAAGIKPGLFYYTLSKGNSAVTRKMIIHSSYSQR